MKSSTYRQTTSYCMGLSVQGMLNWPKREWDAATGPDGYITHSEDGRPYTADELRRALEQAKAEGKKVLPMSNECEGFDFITGCPGHPEAPVAEFGVWMPVDALAPMVGAHVLFCFEDGGMRVGWRTCEDEDWNFRCEPGQHVTTWMPLPEPPQ